MDGRRGGVEGLRRAVAGITYEAKTVIARHPVVAIPLQRIRGHGEVVGDDTQIVIESFPRSASTFAVAAFRLAQEPNPTTIAHHTHMTAQVLEGVRRGLPVLVLIREPAAAVTSLLVRTPDLPVASAIRGFVRFYAPIEPLLPRVVVGTFDQVVGAFGTVIDRVNDRFGTGFRPFEHAADDVARIEAEIEADYRRHVPVDRLERSISSPSAGRADDAARVREALAAFEGDPAWTRAQALYRAFAEAAGG